MTKDPLQKQSQANRAVGEGCLQAGSVSFCTRGSVLDTFDICYSKRIKLQRRILIKSAAAVNHE